MCLRNPVRIDPPKERMHGYKVVGATPKPGVYIALFADTRYQIGKRVKARATDSARVMESPFYSRGIHAWRTFEQAEVDRVTGGAERVVRVLLEQVTHQDEGQSTVVALYATVEAELDSRGREREPIPWGGAQMSDAANAQRRGK